MDHLGTTTGLDLKETDYSREPRVGEFIHLASKDSAAPPGRMRLLLRDAEAVRKVYAALHGQSVQVGQDMVGIEVCNDVVAAAGVAGNGQRGRV